MDQYRTVESLASIAELARPFQPEHLFQEKDIFIAGLDDTNIFRIPALLTTTKGTLLAFCEARERDDQDPLDLVMKRSVVTEKNLQGVGGVIWQNDRKWLPMQVVLPGEGDAISNPCPVVDHSDGTIWMCCLKIVGGLAKSIDAEQGTLLMLNSTDDGATWSEPVEIGHDFGYFVPGPGVGTQMRNGRLVIPGCDSHSSKVIFSDDHGRTWRAGAGIAHRSNESQVIETEDGVLMFNVRTRRCRHVALSRDGGETWYQEYDDQGLPDPGCMAAIVRYSSAADGGKSRLLFANPASPQDRVQLTVKLSYDEGQTWPVGKLVYAGPSAYSSLAVLGDGTIGLLYETGDSHPYERIRFARFSLEWLTDGQDRVRSGTLPLELPLRWNFITDPEDAGIREEWFKKGVNASWQEIWIDSPWTKQGHDYHGVAWYHTRFTVPADLWPGAKLDLLFGAVDGYADVYLDGVMIAEQKLTPRVMRNRPFFASLPDEVKPGQTCDLMVRVRKDDGDAGMWKPVCLVERG